ncbi:MAG: zinc ribbon domain-containing protein [Planctomycetes bacterium]|nr:zinc ribbon domain-containing protein [Planctomycetota bacterium]
MPTYDYVCKACGHELEIFQSITEAPKKKCPKCKKSKLERRIGSGAAILFKGSGFYQTDYRSESYKAAEKADKSESKSSETKASPEPKAAEPKSGDSKPGESKSKDSHAHKSPHSGAHKGSKHKH